MADAGDAVVRDEMILKLYCLKAVDSEAAKKVLYEYEARCRRKIADYENHIVKVKLRAIEQEEKDTSSLFGSYILTQRSLNEALLNLKWCEWARKLYEEADYTFSDKAFNYNNNNNNI